MRDHSLDASAPSLPQLLDDGALACPSSIALVSDQGNMTYARLAEDSRRVASALRKLGLRHGDRLALWLPNVPAWLVLLFACARIGVVVVGVNTRYRSSEVADVVSRSGAKILVFWPGYRGIDFVEMLESIGTDALPELQSVIAYGSPSKDRHFYAFPWPVVPYASLLGTDVIQNEDGCARDGCFIFTTSGTTSKPKLVLHRQGSITRHARDVSRGYDMVAAQSCALVAIPLSGVHGLTVAMSAIAARIPSVLMDKFDEQRMAGFIVSHGVTHTSMIADMLARILATTDVPKPFPSLRVVIGARKGQTAMAESRGIPLLGTYGMSEVQAWLCTKSPDSDFDTREVGGGTLIAPEARVRARDTSTGTILPHGVAGELEILAPSLMAGYFGNDGATAAAFTADGYLRTGDLGYSTSENGFVYISRMGDAMRLDGVLVNPSEIEAIINEHPGVLTSQVVGIETQSGLKPVAFVIPHTAATLDESQITAYCAAKAARFKVPVRVFLLTEFPVTPSANGDKVQKHRLRAMAQQFMDTPTPN